MEKIKALGSEDIVANNIERLKELFPTIFSEGKLVVEELQALLGEYVEKDNEFYQMTWAGKTQAQKEANKLSTGTLRPNKADSKDWDTTGNIFIEGDNLEVLKLLQKTYSNKIKMIYIDPPYNTGKDFVYKDNYKDNLTNYLEITGQTDEEGKKVSTNTDSDGRYHSNWLNMMYPRLKLARNLMKDDGVIFISIDDNEQANLKKLCDEIFGEENFVSNIGWKGKGGGADNKYLIESYENILCYSKNKSIFKVGEEIKLGEVFPKYDEIKKRKYKTQLARKWGANSKRSDRPNLFYSIIAPDNTEVFPMLNDFEEGCWRWSKSKMEYEISNGNIEFQLNNEKWIVYEKIYEPLEGEFNTKKFSNLLLEDGNTAMGSNELKQFFNEKIFDFPKPTTLIKKLINISGIKNDEIALDFFSGSGTTAHAVMALNAEDGGNRKCISVQLPEPTDEKSEAYKAGYKTIAEITKERIRRAGELIKQENKDKEGIDKLDVGFRAFKLDSSNIRTWDTAVDKFEDQLDLFVENNGDSIKADRTVEDVLFEILLKYGLDLTLPIQEKLVDGCTIYNIGFGAMYICLSDNINTSVAVAIGEWHKDSSDTKPSVIFKDAGFANDADKTNTVQTLRQAGIENVKSI